MSNKLLVSIISEQTIPNVQFLKWYAQKHTGETPFDLLFISTEIMEKQNKSNEIMTALSVLDFPYETHYTVTVEQNNLDDITYQLKSYFEDYPHDKIVANITGGTKLMSLGTFQIIQQISGAEIFYKPIDDMLEKIYPDYVTYDESFQLSIDEYLKAVGCDYIILSGENHTYDYIKKVHDLIFNMTGALKIFNCITEKNKDGSFNLNLQKQVQNFRYDSNDFGTAINLCKFLEIDYEKIPSYFPKFILGGWYEEYVYFYLKEKLNLKRTDIVQNLKISNMVENEFDVTFIYKNQLNVIECKAFLKEKTEGKKISDALYKLTALRERLGKSVRLALYTTASDISDANKNRAMENNIEIVTLR